MAFNPAILYLKTYSEKYLKMCAKIHIQGVKKWKCTKCPKTGKCLNKL